MKRVVLFAPLLAIAACNSGDVDQEAPDTVVSAEGEAASAASIRAMASSSRITDARECALLEIERFGSAGRFYGESSPFFEGGTARKAVSEGKVEFIFDGEENAPQFKDSTITWSPSIFNKSDTAIDLAVALFITLDLTADGQCRVLLTQTSDPGEIRFEAQRAKRIGFRSQGNYGAELPPIPEGGDRYHFAGFIMIGFEE